MTGQGSGTNNPSTPPPEDLRKSSHWRQLEESRDGWRDKADKWRTTALRNTVKQAGFDPAKGVGKLLLDQFAQAKDNLDPETLDQEFASYLQENEIEPPSQGGGGEGGNGSGDNAATQLENHMANAQSQANALQNLSQPPSGTPKPLQQQIAEAQAAGDHDKVLQLSYDLATEQFVEAAQRSQVVQNFGPTPPGG